MTDLITFSKYLDNNKHWVELSSQRDSLRQQARDTQKSLNKLMLSQTYMSAAALLEREVIFEWECDCSEDEVKAVSKWTGVNLEGHVEYMVDVIEHLRYQAAKYGADAEKMLAHCKQCEKDANELQEQISALHDKLRHEWNLLKTKHDASKQQEND